MKGNMISKEEVGNVTTEIRSWNSAAMSQELLAATRNWKKQGTYFPLVPLKKQGSTDTSISTQ